ncbi:hypothetical protein Syun_013666 [Stephania yunnanensis]|uniref:Trafficking protein particle complex subunit 12 n=1 Tax=Stephania yunnanensis TaxID=152371 RepID=A0AAP0PB55_9MAGN
MEVEHESKREDDDRETLTIDPLSNQFANLNDLCFEFTSLQDLAFRGSWRSILDKIARARKLSLLQKPHEDLIYLAYSVLALTKLHRYTEAAEELHSMPDFDSPRYRYESHPEIYPNRCGSMVPFAIRWLNAEIPLKLGRRQESLDRLYVLLDFVRVRLRERESRGSELGFCVDVWRKREAFVVYSIASHHLSNKEFVVCLELIQGLVRQDSANAELLSRLGYVQVQVGDLEGAKSTFGEVERLMKEGNLGENEFRNLVGRNKALIYLIGKDYVSAVREYDECIERDPTDVVAINNKALCLMYLRDLSDSIKVLESALERVPTFALNETIVVNLCSMYELAYVNHSEIKRTLSNWIARVAPDDFDSSSTRV